MRPPGEKERQASLLSLVPTSGESKGPCSSQGGYPGSLSSPLLHACGLPHDLGSQGAFRSETMKRWGSVHAGAWGSGPWGWAGPSDSR